MIGLTLDDKLMGDIANSRRNMYIIKNCRQMGGADKKKS